MRHFEYHRLKRNWDFVWDCYQGSDAVKRGKNARIYLPMLRREREEYERSGKTRAPHYELRKSSASYENLFKPVVDDIVGIMQKNAPTVKFGVDNDEESPEEVRSIRWYGNQFNDGVTGLKHRLNFNQTLFGRYGLLLDIVTDPQGLNPKFCITEYTAPKILDGEAKRSVPTGRRQSGGFCSTNRHSSSTAKPKTMTSLSGGAFWGSTPVDATISRCWNRRRLRIPPNGRNSIWTIPPRKRLSTRCSRGGSSTLSRSPSAT